MTDAELRALVRDVIARQLGDRVPSPGAAAAAPQGARAAAAAPPGACAAAAAPPGACAAPVPVVPSRGHASHAQFAFPTPDACVIEPSVPCSHCGYCKSYGH